MGFVNSLKDETKFLFSGKGMPYEKVCLTIAMIISLGLSVLLAGNFAKDAPVIVIDLDNSKYSRELITQIDSSEYMRVKAVLNVPAPPSELFYRDETDAVIYLPQGLEKNFYNGNAAPVGIFYDNSNTAQTADIKAAMNELIAINNAMANPSAAGGLTLNDRNLFNPAGSTSNTQTQGFLSIKERQDTYEDLRNSVFYMEFGQRQAIRRADEATVRSAHSATHARQSRR